MEKDKLPHSGTRTTVIQCDINDHESAVICASATMTHATLCILKGTFHADDEL